jgi:cellobiose phosphorylase
MLSPYLAGRGAWRRYCLAIESACDYVEATGDLAFLDEPVAWRGDDNLEKTGTRPHCSHVDKLLATVRERFVAGTHLIRFGNGD